LVLVVFDEGFLTAFADDLGHQISRSLKLLVPGHQLSHEFINLLVVAHISAKGAGYMEHFVFLVELAGKKICIHAVDDGIFQLTNIFNLEDAHQVVVAERCFERA
jgi:anti-anti-sigma regulatory factor